MDRGPFYQLLSVSPQRAARGATSFVEGGCRSEMVPVWCARRRAFSWASGRIKKKTQHRMRVDCHPHVNHCLKARQMRRRCSSAPAGRMGGGITQSAPATDCSSPSSPRSCCRHAAEPKVGWLTLGDDCFNRTRLVAAPAARGEAPKSRQLPAGLVAAAFRVCGASPPRSQTSAVGAADPSPSWRE
jgi:hypothetical protein